MIKPVGPNSSSKCRLYCEKQPNAMMSSCSAGTALTCAVFHELELVQDRNFFFPRQTRPFRGSHLARMKRDWQLMFANRCGCGCQGEMSLQQPHLQLGQFVRL